MFLFAANVRADISAYDSNGNRPGEVLDVSTMTSERADETFTGVKIFVGQLSRCVLLDNNTGQLAAPGAALYFEGVGCRGQAFVDSGLFYGIAKIGENYYTGDSFTRPESIEVRSALRPGPDGGAVCANEFPEATKLYLVPATEMKDIHLELPVSLPIVLQRGSN